MNSLARIRNLGRSHLYGRGGFALVIALSVMGFLFLLMVSLASLSVVGVQTAENERDSIEAEEMALFGLRVALGRLQALAGPDQRITASASIEDDNPLTESVDDIEQPYWLGVWNAAETMQDGAANIEYGQLSGWLVSGNAPDPVAGPENPVTLYQLADESSPHAVAVDMESVTSGDTSGAYAYAVFDESLKAQLSAGSHPSQAQSRSELPDSRRVMAGAGGVDASVLKGGSDTESFASMLDRKPTRSDFPILEPTYADFPEYFHQYTDCSYSLQTNTREGGLKRDLSLAFEMDGRTSETNALTLFNSSEFAGDGARTSEDSTSALERNYGESFYARFLFAEYADNSLNDASGDDVIRGPTWHLLRDYYNLYKLVDGVRSNSPSLAARAMFPNTPEVPSTISDSVKGNSRALSDFFRYQGNVFTGIMWAGDSGVNEYATNKLGGNVLGYSNRPTQGSYGLLVQRIIYNFSVMNIDGDFTLVMSPIVVLWNPYNVVVHMDESLKIVQDNLPIYFHIRLERADGSLEEYLADYRTLHKAYGNTAQGKDLQLFISNSGGLNFEPGEIKIYSLPDSSPVSYDTLIGSSNSPNMYLEDGMRYGGGTYYQDFLRLTGITDGQPFFDGSGVTRIPLGAEPTGTPPVVEASSLSVEIYPAHFKGNSSAAIQTDNIGAGQNYNYLVASVFSVDAGNLSDSARGYWKGDRQIQYIHTPLSHGGTFEVYADLGVDEQLLDVAVLLGIPNVRLELFNIDYRLLPSLDIMTASLFEDFNPRSAVRSAQTSNFPRATAPQVLISSEPQSSMASVIESSGSNAYWGDTLGGSGETHVTAWEIPTEPLLSIAALQHADIALLDYQPAHAIGNSSASPYVPLNKLYDYQTGTSPARNTTVYDLSYYANKALWDGYFFSGLAPEFSESGGYAETKTLEAVIDDWIDASPGTQLRDPRVRFLSFVEDDVNVTRAKLKGQDGYRESAAHLVVEGGFNVNSVSVEAWKSVLTRALGDDAEMVYLRPSGSLAEDSASGIPFSSFTLPNGDSSDAWKGFRRLTRADIHTLAVAIVEQVKRRGPFLSLSDFVNRGLQDDAYSGDLRLSGAIQSAIDAADINSSIESVGIESNTTDFTSPAAAAGSTTRGIAGSITQADVLMALGSSLTVRGDTFTFRAYGEVRDTLTNKVKARRWCEAQVQRLPTFVSSNDNAVSDNRINWSAENEKWGRTFRIISFRWLNPEEV